jgi:hypothetical protein
MITSFFTQGHTGREDVHAGTMSYFSANYFYQQLENMIDFSQQTAEQFGHLDPAVTEIQRRYINNDTWTAPFQIPCDWHLEDWRRGQFRYEIEPPEQIITANPLTLFTLQRRHKKLYNTINAVPVTTDTANIDLCTTNNKGD